MGKVQVKQLRDFVKNALDLEAVKASPELVKLIANATAIADDIEKEDDEQSKRYSSLQEDYINLVKSYGTGSKGDSKQEDGTENKSLEELFEEAEAKSQEKK